MLGKKTFGTAHTNWHDEVTTVKITGKVWVFDEGWDDGAESTESITITVKNSNGVHLLRVSDDGGTTYDDGLTFTGKVMPSTAGATATTTDQTSGDNSAVTSTTALSFHPITKCGIL